MTAAFSTTPLDDFLAGADSSTETGQLLQRIGLVGSMLGLIVAAGLLVFLGAVHRGTRREVSVLVRAVSLAGAFALVGAVVEIAGQASIDGTAWTEALTSTPSSAAMMRVLAGLLILLGVFEYTAPVGDDASTTIDLERNQDGGGSAGDEPLSPSADSVAPFEPDAATVRWVPVAASSFGCVGAVVGLLSFAFDGHTVTEGPRLLHAGADVAHVAAGGVWVGGVVGLCLVSWMRWTTATSSASLVIRFSTVAAAALIIAALFGVLMSLMIMDDFGVLIDTDWGRRLLVKLGVVAVAAGIGGYNRWVVVPSLESAGSRAVGDVRARRALTVESLVLMAVVVITTFLTVASPT